MKNLAIFASGSGTNAENFVNYFSNNKKIRIGLIVSSNRKAYVLERAKNMGIPSVVLTKSEMSDSRKVLSILHDDFHIDFIVLAGYLLRVPPYLVEAYPRAIVNIHPALLPKYGGQGMYGDHVHEAVIAAGETESGITIHYVNEEYDSGATIFQATCPVMPDDTPHTLAERIHALEYANFPRVVDEVVSRM